MKIYCRIGSQVVRRRQRTPMHIHFLINDFTFFTYRFSKLRFLSLLCEPMESGWLQVVERDSLSSWLASSNGFGVWLMALFSDDVDPMLFVSLQFNWFSISPFLFELCSMSVPALFARSPLLGRRGGASLFVAALKRSSFSSVPVSGGCCDSIFVFPSSNGDGVGYSEALSVSDASSFTFDSLVSNNSSKLWLRWLMLDGSGGRRADIADADARRILSVGFVANCLFCNGCMRPPLGKPLIHLRFGLVDFVNFDGDDAVAPLESERPSSQSEFFSLSESLLCILWYISGFCRTVAVPGVLGVASPRKPGRKPVLIIWSRSPRINLELREWSDQ